VNEPYEWVEKAVVFRPELRNWQSLVRADVPFLGSRAPSDPFILGISLVMQSILFDLVPTALNTNPISMIKENYKQLHQSTTA